jgi:AraC-like DNA-binding protein
MALVIAADFSGKEMDLYHLGRLSVDGVIRLEDQPDRRQIRTAVDRAMASSLATRAIAETDGTLPPMVQGIIRWSIEHAEAQPQVSDLAAALAMSPRVLRKEMRTLDLPSPRAFLLWGRLVRAIDLLERPNETVEGVALHLGYATGGALGRAFRRHIGMSPTALLDKGGLQWTLETFLRGGLFLGEAG